LGIKLLALIKLLAGIDVLSFDTAPLPKKEPLPIVTPPLTIAPVEI
jgi:hypothetical protein